jgi:YidC/Oxa1 family membrane protein insertase
VDIQRLILFFVFSFSVLLLWEAWQKEARVQTAQTTQSAPATAEAAPKPTQPTSASPAPKPSAVATPSAPVAPKSDSSVQSVVGEKIRVTTDMVVADIDTLGGSLVYLELREHKDASNRDKNLVLLGPEHKYVLNSGLTEPGLPNHTTLYKSAVKEARMGEKDDQLRLELEAVSASGVRVQKTFVFRRGSYLIEIKHQIENGSSTPVGTHAYYQLVRDGKAPADDNAMAPTYTGAAMFNNQEKFQKISFSDIDKNKTNFLKTPTDGWVAFIQHHFVSALIPPEKLQREVYTKKSGDLYSVGVFLPIAAVAPGEKAEVGLETYIGPQEQARLKKAATGLDLVVDYGMLAVIAAPLFWILEMFFDWTGNWGLAIILLTVVIKAIFYPLSAASYKSMAKMKLVTPRLTQLREIYGNDRMKLNQAMMELYKTEKINPLGGCLPILVQIPVFISLYWVLLAAVELRHAPFYGWITDLAAIDPWYVLPALMMVSMIVQTKLNPVPPDPVQAKVMQIMPFAFGIMFFFFPAGLVLYWLVNNILSIAQQWQITNMIEGAKSAPKR